MCYFCFDVLFSHLHNIQDPIQVPFTCEEKYPLFVTWKIGKRRKLRGCVGTFSELELEPGLREYAVCSATEDSRFPPISKEDLPHLQVTLSILCHFEKGTDYRDWEVGVHGIRIEFKNIKGIEYTATYLPKVALEQGWDQKQTVDSLIEKAGYKENITKELRNQIQLTRYQCENISVSYEDYLANYSSRFQEELAS
ncbi:AMMECR1-like protein isoform X2 [Eurytemora carolleeae]|nr:AMMECR1-like protein isoform X2 [Eurytemora carolleeae]|eukprot:XP_023329563.1 AMMECR1-like protein isoform X2 [Eurytemora affinis]